MVDVLRVVLDHFDAVLGVPAEPAVPDPRPGSFVVVMRTGGPRSRVGDEPELTVEAWALTIEGAHELARSAWDALDDLRGRLPGGGMLRRIDDVGGIVSLPDDVSNQPRFTFTRQLFVRG